MNLFGIIGYPLAHSFSQNYFSEKFLKLGLNDHEYKTFPIENISGFQKIISENPSLTGLSVTIPHKESVIPFLHELDDSAKNVGAVNCIKLTTNNNNAEGIPSGQTTKLTGYNTDIFGFKQAVKPFLESHHNRALILGTGGASKAVAFVLKELGIDFNFVTRTLGLKLPTSNFFNYEELNPNHISAHHLIINTTPLGMFPNINSAPEIPYAYLTSQHFCFDLVYNPEETLFIKRSKDKGALTQNGLTMLHQQAEKAWEIWNT